MTSESSEANESETADELDSCDLRNRVSWRGSRSLVNDQGNKIFTQPQ